MALGSGDARAGDHAGARTIPPIAAAIARAIEQAESEEGLTAPRPHERSAWAAEARGELVDDGLA